MNRPKFLAFIKDAESSKVVKEYAKAKNLPDDFVIEGNIETAHDKLSAGARNPEFLLVELSSKDHKEAFDNLDKLANACEPDTKVIVIGDIDELSFYKELIHMGVHEYLLNPVKSHQVERVTTAKGDSKKDESTLGHRNKGDCRIISVMGTRGGVGTSTIAINLANSLAGRHYPTVLLDLDPDFGVIPLLLDVEPNRGLIDALEKPERVDALFLDRVMTKISDNLFVIGAEKNLNDTMHASDKAAQVLVDLLKTKFAYVVIDIPRIEHYNHFILENSDNVVVTELSIPGLRDTMRIYDLLKETFSNQKITLVANKTGINKKFEAPLKDFETGLGKKIDFTIPFEAEIYGFHNSGAALVHGVKDSKFARAVAQLAVKFTPQGAARQASAVATKSSIFNKIKAKMK